MRGSGPWGVRLERVGEAIVIAPSGDLDDEGAARLRQVLRSREGFYAELVLDLREVVSVAPAGVELVADEARRSSREGFRLVVAARPRLARLLNGAGAEVVGDLEPVLERHRAR